MMCLVSRLRVLFRNRHKLGLLVWKEVGIEEAEVEWKNSNCTVGTHEIKIKFWISHWELQVLIFHLTTFKARGVTEIRIAGKSCGASSSNMDPISKATALTGYSPSEKSVQFVQGLHCPVSHTCVCCLWKEPLMQPSWGAPITWTGSLSPEEDKWLDSEVLTDNEAFYAVKREPSPDEQVLHNWSKTNVVHLNIISHVHIKYYPNCISILLTAVISSPRIDLTQHLQELDIYQPTDFFVVRIRTQEQTLDISQWTSRLPRWANSVSLWHRCVEIINGGCVNLIQRRTFGFPQGGRGETFGMTPPALWWPTWK